MERGGGRITNWTRPGLSPRLSYKVLRGPITTRPSQPWRVLGSSLVSIPVELAKLAEQIEKFGDIAYLVTVEFGGSPHVVSVRVRWDDDGNLVVGAGVRTSANVEPHPSVTLLWPATPGGDYALIVDGRAECVTDVRETSIRIIPATAVVHRTPEGDPSTPSCIRVLDPS